MGLSVSAVRSGDKLDLTIPSEANRVRLDGRIKELLINPADRPKYFGMGKGIPGPDPHPLGTEDRKGFGINHTFFASVTLTDDATQREGEAEVKFTRG